jgi:hypothetical protein
MELRYTEGTSDEIARFLGVLPPFEVTGAVWKSTKSLESGQALKVVGSCKIGAHLPVGAHAGKKLSSTKLHGGNQSLLMRG